MQYASPATVSRAGMVYVDPKNLGYRPYWDRWILGRIDEDEQEQLNELFKNFVPPCMALIFEGIIGMQTYAPLKTIVPQTGLNMVPILLIYYFI